MVYRHFCSPTKFEIRETSNRKAKDVCPFYILKTLPLSQLSDCYQSWLFVGISHPKKKHPEVKNPEKFQIFEKSRV